MSDTRPCFDPACFDPECFDTGPLVSGGGVKEEAVLVLPEPTQFFRFKIPIEAIISQVLYVRREIKITVLRVLYQPIQITAVLVQRFLSLFKVQSQRVHNLNQKMSLSAKVVKTLSLKFEIKAAIKSAGKFIIDLLDDLDKI